ncbi:penicillin-binding transpeptidase domain-containing protein [Microlunatus capsulatus]|uniref:Beta-lactamase n=1 Tax=Microlunatus capsulatus TaxID=99117 RepID=A0ABS4ZC66_9ACTN|nr:penicillin-binding transpeptidase domain-containing protein [Microlunatus capsulatus]MBP2418658.1 cell division protein FtsI/penicillin-binding protein 2 [Microlunatus capsulatus]
MRPFSPDVARARPARRPRWTSLAVAALLLAGCTSTPGPDPDDAGAQAAADALAAGLAAKDLTPVAFEGATGAEAEARLDPLVAGMGPLAPVVTAGPVSTDGDTARSTLTYRWTFPGVPAPWTYEAPAQLVREAGTWKTRWAPTLLEPSLNGSQRLSQRRLYPERGEVLGEDGDPLVTQRSVIRIGLDKTAVSGAAATRSARQLAALLDIDAGDYVDEVADAGPQAFVEALTVRAEADDRPDDGDVRAITGALALEDRQMLAPTRTFARSLLGTVGEATKEDVDAAGGAVVTGDQVGRSGLQKRYDEQLRGVPGVQVVRAPLATGASPSPSPSADPSPSASPSPAADLFRVAPTAGEPLELTLNQTLQQLAEDVLADTGPASALVAVRPSTGAVLAAANGPGAGDQALATTGQFPPGSTFKVASSLALLRAGLTPTSPVRCPATLEVDGFRFKNYSDYPGGSLGRIDLRTALAQSCNTAFIGERDELGRGDLADAAASLGLGTDYDVGFPSFFGAVPEESSETGRGAAMIGQAKDQASPLAMAAVVASVQAGKTVVPHLLDGTVAEPTAAPLTEDEADQLRAMMRRVVTQGSAGGVLGDLDGPAVLAKTGTAEYGDDEPRKTHAWMIAAQGDLAVAVFVADGASGSRTAGPLLADFLRGTR